MQDLDFKLEKIEEKGNFGKFTISPLSPGFGDTLGNALRRVLLSSLKGAAATKIKIEGVTHRFSTLKGLKEDIVEFLLNVKEIRFQLNNIDNAQVTLAKKGPGEITAGDLVCPAGVEVVNKDLVLGNLADKKSNLKMELEIESGYGYSPFEERNLEKIGVILLDAVFSPIILVNYKVEKTRVGRMINLDKLVIEVTTDGTVKPKEAVMQAVEILLKYFSKLKNGKAKKIEKEIPFDQIPLEKLGLQVRVENMLTKANVLTAQDLTVMTKQDLLNIKHMGQKSIQKIKKSLAKHNLSLKELPDEKKN